jgi:hypothetical protein
MLDSRGNKESEWKENEKRGGYPYIPPKGWKGYGLKVMDVYDNGNNDWIAKDGNPNEWAVAYHGIGSKLGSTVEDATRLIFMGGFKSGEGQVYKDAINDNPIIEKPNAGGNSNPALKKTTAIPKPIIIMNPV